MKSSILFIRLHSQGLDRARFDSPVEVVRHMGAIQAQDIPQALRCVGSRIAHSNVADIKNALTKGEIIRTRPMRGTLHYLVPENVHRMLDLCASKTLKGFTKRREFLGISDQYAEKSLSLIQSTLQGGKILTRSALGETLKAGGIPMQTQRVYHLACYAATRKLICFGPPTDKEETFVLLDERISHKVALTRDEQLAKLAHMYITGHGPVSVDDLARWSGLTKTECKQAFDLICDQFEMLEISGKKYYYQPPSQITAPSGIHLLGGFDEYFLGYKDRSLVADVQHHKSLFTVNGIFFPLIMLEGKIVGTRKRIRKGKSLEINISALPGMSLPMGRIQEKAEQYAQFWGAKDYKVEER